MGSCCPAAAQSTTQDAERMWGSSACRAQAPCTATTATTTMGSLHCCLLLALALLAATPQLLGK